MEAELKNIALVGGVMALIFGTWMILTLKSGILKLRTNFMMVAVKMFGFLYLVRDLGPLVVESQLGSTPPNGTRDALTALLIISAGFVIDRLWRHFVWDGVMVADGDAPAPRLLRGAFTTLIMLFTSGVVIS